MLKSIIKKVLLAIGSRMTYLLIGLSFSVVVIAVNAAVTITSTNVGAGEMLTAARWNTLVGDLNVIRDEINGQSLECVTKSVPMSTCSGEMCSGIVYCDTGWLMTGGGVYANMYDWWEYLMQSYPVENGWRGAQTIDSHLGTVYVRCCR